MKASICGYDNISLQIKKMDVVISKPLTVILKVGYTPLVWPEKTQRGSAVDVGCENSF